MRQGHGSFFRPLEVIGLGSSFRVTSTTVEASRRSCSTYVDTQHLLVGPNPVLSSDGGVINTPVPPLLVRLVVVEEVGIRTVPSTSQPVVCRSQNTVRGPLHLSFCPVQRQRCRVRKTGDWVGSFYTLGSLRPSSSPVSREWETGISVTLHGGSSPVPGRYPSSLCSY